MVTTILKNTACSVSLEHPHSFKILLARNNFTSAVSLLRLQFECLVHGMWILYAASETALIKLTAEPNKTCQNITERRLPIKD
jgi:hypothetical protein